MPLITGSQLLPRFRELAINAERVDIAVAWAKQCDALDALAEAAETDTRTRIALGLSMNGTDPTALKHLHEFAMLRVASPRSGIFHPKFYSFRGNDWTICWVGSSNLTAGGFGGNTELVYEFEDNARKGRDWFRPLWQSLDPDPGPAIAAYIEAYTPPVPSPRSRFRGGEPEVDPQVVPLPYQATWEEIVQGLRTRDDYCNCHEYPWDILGRTFSYLHTIARGREIAQREAWVDLGPDECAILTGSGAEDGAWGLLGTLNPFTRHDFGAEDGDVREQIRKLLGPVVDIPDGKIVPVNVAQDAVHAIMQLRNFGPAAATRLVTLVRPDCLVSVNSESASGLASLSEVTDSVDRPPSAVAEHLANEYAGLLNWVYRQDWFSAPEPDDALEREIWRSRAALLDAFVYPPINPNAD